MLLRGTPSSLCVRYAYETVVETPPRRARSPESPRGTPHHFAVATPTKPRRAERARPAALRITLRLLLRLRYSAALSAFAPRHRTSLCGCYAYEAPPRRARSLRGTPHHFAVATPTTLRRRCGAPTQAGPDEVCSLPGCCLAGSGLALYGIYTLVPSPMTFTFIPSTPPTSLSFNFSTSRFKYY